MRQGSIRVLIAKPGLDGHEMGARLVSRALMDAGMEVIYTGPRQTPETVVSTALQEDVDVIGLSFLTGAHKEHTAKVMRLMEERGMDLGKTVLVVGGIIPPKDVDYLISLGVDAVFGPGSDTRNIAKTISDAMQKKRGGKDRPDFNHR
ncbi:cobalamin B12-binding domain-containing protein [Chloroflexota bacterium]